MTHTLNRTMVQLLISLVFIVFISLIYIIYKRLYKKHINNTLNGGKSHLSFIEPFNFIIMIFLIFITIFLFYLNSQINVIKSDLESVQNEQSNNNNLLNFILGDIGNIDDQVQEIHDKDKLVSDYSYQTKSISSDYQTITTNFTLNLKNSDPSSKMYLLVTNDQDESTWQKIALETNDYLLYHIDLTITVGETYKVDLLQVNDTSTKKETITTIYFNHFTDHINVDYHVTKDHLVEYSSSINYLVPNLKIVKVYLETEINGVTDKKDVTSSIDIAEDEKQTVQKFIGTFDYDPDKTNYFRIILETSDGNTFSSDKYQIN